MRLSQPTETVRVPVSSRPIVCGVVGGSQRAGDIVEGHAARAAHFPNPRDHPELPKATNQNGFSSVLQFCRCGKLTVDLIEEREMVAEAAAAVARRTRDRSRNGRRSPDAASGRSDRSPSTWPNRHWAGCSRAASSPSANIDAGERLRADWERAQLAPRVTMAWDAAPVARGRGGSAAPARPRPARRSTPAPFRRTRSPAPGRAWPTSCGASFAPAKECAKPKPRSAGRRAQASWS